jgi:hypothetical protein
MIIQEILECFAREKDKQNDERMNEFIEFISNNDSFIITNHHLFYAISNFSDNFVLINALKNAKRNMHSNGSSSVIQNKLEKLVHKFNEIKDISIFNDFFEDIIALINEVRCDGLRVSSESYDYATNNLGDFKELIDVLKVNVIDN